jgi:hypothetical protein
LAAAFDRLDQRHEGDGSNQSISHFALPRPVLSGNRIVGDCKSVAAHVFVSGGGRGCQAVAARAWSIAERRLNLVFN